MKDTEIPRQQCPYCGCKQDTTSSALGDYTPTPGCYSICLNCRKVSVFGDDMQTRKPTDEEAEAILQHGGVTRVQMAIAAVNAPDLRKRHRPDRKDPT